IGEGSKTRGKEKAAAFERRNRPLAAKQRIVEIDRAARITEIGVASRGENAAALFVEAMGNAAHFGAECGILAANFAEISGAQQQPALRVRPVDQEYLD